MINEEQVKNEILELIKARTRISPITSTRIFQKLKDKNLIDNDITEIRFGLICRDLINKLRQENFPVLATIKGYYWPQNEDEILEYIGRFEARCRKEYQAIRGLKKSIKSTNLSLFEKLDQAFELEPVK